MADISKITIINETYDIKDTTARNNISTLQADVSTLQTDVGTLQTDVGTLQTDVDTLQTDNSNNKELFINIEDFGAKGDGITDDTIAIQNAFNSNYSNFIFPNKIYLITAPINIPSSVKNINLQNAHLKYNYEQIENTENNLFNISGNNKLTINGGKIEYLGTFDFNNESYAGRVSGIKINNSNNISIKNCEILNFNRHGITLAYNENGTNEIYCENITIDNCNLHHNRVAGVLFGNTKNLIIKNCKLCYNGKDSDTHTGYGCAAQSSYIPKNTFIINNYASYNYRKGIDFHSGISGIIDNNICEQNKLYGIYYDSINEIGTWHITNNIIKDMTLDNADNFAKHGIFVGSMDTNNSNKYSNFIISNNSIIDCSTTNNSIFYPIYINNNNLYENHVNISNNYINCGNIGAFIFVQYNSRKSLTIVSNNYMKASSTSTIPVYDNDEYFDTFKFVNNYIEVTNNSQPYTVATTTPVNLSTAKLVFVDNIAISPQNANENVFLYRALTNLIHSLNIINNTPES